MSLTAKSLAAGAILALALAATGTAQANGMKAGFLKCNVAGNVSFIFGSSRDIDCIYDAGSNHPIDHYKGTIKKYGVDIGYQQNGVIVWGVVALLTQLIAYGLARLTVPNLAEDIAKASVAPAIWLGCISIASGIISAACMSY